MAGERFEIENDDVQAFFKADHARQASPGGSDGVTECFWFENHAGFPHRNFVAYIFPYDDAVWTPAVKEAWAFEARAWRAYWALIERRTQGKGHVFNVAPLLQPIDQAVYVGDFVHGGLERTFPMFVRPHIDWPSAESLADLKGGKGLQGLEELVQEVWDEMGALPHDLELQSLKQGFLKARHLLTDGHDVVPTQFRFFHRNYRNIRLEPIDPSSEPTLPRIPAPKGVPHAGSPSPLNPDAQFLVGAARTLEAFPALGEAVRHAEKRWSGRGPSMASQLKVLQVASAELRKRATKSDQLSGNATRYLTDWENREQSIDTHVADVHAFFQGVRALVGQPGELEDRVAQMVTVTPYKSLPTGDHDYLQWDRGFRSWRRLCPAGQAGEDQLVQHFLGAFFRETIVPWLSHAQFLEEALPIEVPGIRPTEPLVAPVLHAARAFGFTIQHLGLYDPAHHSRSLSLREDIDMHGVSASSLYEGFTVPPSVQEHYGVLVRVVTPAVLESSGPPLRANLIYLDQ